jgi:hypothetical protein
VGQQIYEMIASNFFFNFIPKELLHMKNNSSKYELKLSATLRMPCTYYTDVTETAGMLYTAYGTEGLKGLGGTSPFSPLGRVGLNHWLPLISHLHQYLHLGSGFVNRR